MRFKNWIIKLDMLHICVYDRRVNLLTVELNLTFWIKLDIHSSGQIMMNKMREYTIGDSIIKDFNLMSLLQTIELYLHSFHLFISNIDNLIIWSMNFFFSNFSIIFNFFSNFFFREEFSREICKNFITFFHVEYVIHFLSSC